MNTGEIARSVENAKKAYELRQRVSERERYYIESIYSNIVTENLDSARQINELWAQTYPRDSIPWNRLYSVYLRLGDFDKALSAIQQSLSLEPENGVSYVNLTGLYVSLNRLDEAKATIQEGLSKNVDSPETHYSLYMISFMENDTAGLEREAGFLLRRPGWEPLVLQLESETAANAGRFSRARELVVRAIDSSQRAGRKGTTGGLQAQSAFREALIGNLAFAKRQAEDALTLSDSIYVQAVSAIVLGLAGDTAKATRLADDLARRLPENTNIQFYHLPMVRGVIAIQGGKPDRAIEALAATGPYEMGTPRSINLFTLYPIYFRGLAHLAARQGAEAAVEFQKIIDRPGLVLNKVIGPLAHLGLARALVIAGDSTRARTAYQDFLAIWKDADSDIPILKEARTEYSRLK
jgi:tetratricopeptide (TPR) repeat protein